LKVFLKISLGEILFLIYTQQAIGLVRNSKFNLSSFFIFIYFL